MKIEILINKMRKNNISIKSLSKIIKCDDRSLGMILNKRTINPRIDTVVKMAKALGLSKDEFLELCEYRDSELWK